jgi:hypothetical protein
MNNSNMPVPDMSKIEKKLAKDKEVAQAERNSKIKELLKLAQISNVPQIVLDSFENIFSTNYNFNLKNETLIQRAMLCYKKHDKLIKKLPKDLAATFIYEYCTYQNEEDEIVNNYSYYRGYKEVFYLLHGLSSVFIVFNGTSLQKDQTKYISDYSWGYIDLSSDDTFPDDKRVSGNTTQTAEVILKAIFPNDDGKLNLVPLFIESFLIQNTIYGTNSSFSKEDVLNWYNNLNLIKRVCLEQKVTYKEFGVKVGFGEGAIKNAAASGKISDQLKRATEMYLEILRLSKENEKFKKLQELMKEITSI